MIFDTIDHLNRYAGLNPALDRAIAFFGQNPLAALAPGRHEIDGERAYCTRLECSLSLTRDWEAHEAHIDLHIALRDGETVFCRDAATVPGWGELNRETDAKHAPMGLESARILMPAGTFAVFFPWDAHSPQHGVGTTEKIIAKLEMK